MRWRWEWVMLSALVWCAARSLINLWNEHGIIERFSKTLEHSKEYWDILSWKTVSPRILKHFLTFFFLSFWFFFQMESQDMKDNWIEVFANLDNVLTSLPLIGIVASESFDISLRFQLALVCAGMLKTWIVETEWMRWRPSQSKRSEFPSAGCPSVPLCSIGCGSGRIERSAQCQLNRWLPLELALDRLQMREWWKHSPWPLGFLTHRLVKLDKKWEWWKAETLDDRHKQTLGVKVVNVDVSAVLSGHSFVQRG